MKLHYFNAYARAEPIRMLLWLAKVPYEDVTHYKWPEWETKQKYSGEFELGQLPVLEEVDGVKYYQSIPILRYLGSKYGYYPVNDPKKAYLIDSAIENVQDLQNNIAQVIFNKDVDDKVKKLTEWHALWFPMWALAMNNRLK